jgi:hypothetical protein
MQKPPSHPYPKSASKGTVTNSRAFVETIEYNRFVEFCDAAISVISGYATDRQALGKLSPRFVTAGRTRLFHAIVGQAK